MQIFIYCKVTLHISGVTTTFSRSTKTVTAVSGTGHNTGTATSLQRGLIRPRFITLIDGCCDNRNMQNVFGVNKCLHTVAFSWIFINIYYDARTHELQKNKSSNLLTSNAVFCCIKILSLMYNVFFHKSVILCTYSAFHNPTNLLCFS